VCPVSAKNDYGGRRCPGRGTELQPVVNHVSVFFVYIRVVGAIESAPKF